MQDGELREENYVNKVYPQVIAGPAVVRDPGHDRRGNHRRRGYRAVEPAQVPGFVAQEQFDAESWTIPSDNRFGSTTRRAAPRICRPRSWSRPGRSSAARRGRRAASPRPASTQEMSPGENAARYRRHTEAPRHDSINAGTWSGTQGREESPAPLIKSVNPATGDARQVRGATVTDYEAVMRQRGRSRRRVARGAGAAARRGDPPAGRRAARSQGALGAWSRSRTARSRPRATAKSRR